MSSIDEIREARIKKLKLLKDKGMNPYPAESKRDLFMAGVGIYIGEGTKTNGIVRIINADPKIIKFMVKWFELMFGVKAQNLKAYLNI